MIPKIIKSVSLSIVLSLILTNIATAQEQTPSDIVNVFVNTYGGPYMDELADYTTPNFRDNKPKSVWVVDTWKSLKQIKYRKIRSTVIASKVKGNKAVFIVDATIVTKALKINQKELYYLIKEDGKWLINDLVVTDEDFDLENEKL